MAKALFPRICIPISPNFFSVDKSTKVFSCWDSKEFEDAAPEAGKLGHKDGGIFVFALKRVTVDVGEQVDDAASRGAAAGAILGVQRQVVEPVSLHRLT